MLGLSGSELKEAASLSESVRHGLDDISQEKDDPLMRMVAKGFEANVGVSVATAVRMLHTLEISIEEKDQSSLSEINDIIDAIVDYLVVSIALAEANVERGGKALQRLEHIRRDAGRLAQYVCQLTEGTP